jgi:MinD-like ATPase involved in chromosome partitioning or flagellar assembly
MGKIISIHSFRGGTGKSNITASLAVLLASEGRRIGIIDTDIQSPGIHVIFGLKEQDIKHSLNEYLWGMYPIEDAAHDVTAILGRNGVEAGQAKIMLIPSSMKTGEIARILREGSDVDMLRDGIRHLVKALNLDFLFIDTHPGLNEETLLSIAASDALIVIMRPDQQDYQGTRITIEVARKLRVPRMMILVNKTPRIFEPSEVAKEVAQTYDCEVAGVLPYSEEMMNLGSATAFVLRYPDHPITAKLKEIATALTK